MSLPDRVAHVIHEVFDQLPRKSKPRSGEFDGIEEWVPLSGICLCSEQDEIRCIALGTGMKCLPLVKVATANGIVLHDWHAEVLAMRAFNRFILDECSRLLGDSDASSDFLIRRLDKQDRTPPLSMDPKWKIVMYCSEAPCGDASIETIMARQVDATPWPVEEQAGTSQQLLGQGSFSQLGIVRRKPSRPDSPATLSKSCSDKIAMKQCTSLLSALTTILVSPENAYIDKLILPKSQYIRAACERAFGPRGRMLDCVGQIRDEPFSYRPFTYHETSLEFRYSRETASHRSRHCKGSTTTSIWTPNFQETLVNGVLQGRRQDDLRGASSVSRRHMGLLLGRIVGDKIEKLQTLHAENSYGSIKDLDGCVGARKRIKAQVIEFALKGWPKNDTDDYRLDWNTAP